LNITGDGTNVLTRGQLSFAKPLPFEIEKWNIPTNLIQEPIQSFTAIQGLKPWISSLASWEKLHTGSAPNQLFCWAQSGSPFLGYAAAPLLNGSSAMSKLGPAIIDAFNPLLASNRMGKWERATNSDGVVWNRAPIIYPFVQSTSLAKESFLLAGLTPRIIANTTPPLGTFHQLSAVTNLVYFDSEITGARLEAWMFTSQLFRIILRREQLPAEAKVIAWFRAVGPKLGNSVTMATKVAPTELSLTRTSTLGLTSIEFQILADWLESPEFPFHLRSTVAKLPPLPARKNGK
jgi:hypothetical protein